jgi:hypothetical protein
MIIKGKKIENRTILIISAVILIILASYYLIINLPPEVNYITVEELLRNQDNYINKLIIIRGYYDSNGLAIVSSPSDAIGKSTLKLDHSQVQNASDILINDKKYDFTGILQETNVGGPDNIVIFKVSKIEVV